MNTPTEEDLQLVKSYILLPMLLTLFERDSKVINNSDVKFPNVYSDFYQRLMDNVSKDHSKTRNEMRLRGIKVYDEFKNELEVGCKYLCRGHQRNFSMLITFLKAEVEIAMRHYLGEDISKYHKIFIPHDKID